MKIKVSGYLTIRKVMGEMCLLEIEKTKPTIIEVLAELSDRFGQRFKDLILDSKTKKIREDVRVLLNGRHHKHLKDGLETELKEGDEIALFPPIAGG